MAEGSQQGRIAGQKVVHAQYFPLRSILQGVQLHIRRQGAYPQLSRNVLVLFVSLLTAWQDDTSLGLANALHNTTCMGLVTA